LANPFLVLGGIAIAVVTAAFGVLAVPGWVISAQDSSAINDLSSTAGAQETALSVKGTYLPGADLAASFDELGVGFTLSDGVKLCATVSPGGSGYAAVALSPSGAFFARTSENTEAKRGNSAASALTAAGGLPTGVPAPVTGTDCAPGSAIPGSTWSATPGGGSSTPVGGPALGDPGVAALGAVTSAGDIMSSTWTQRGVFAGNNSGSIVQSGPGAAAHSVTFTGDAADTWSIFGYRGVGADTEGNLYFGGVGPHGPGGDMAYVVYKATPDNATTVFAAKGSSDGTPEVRSTAVGTVYVTWNGVLYKVNGGSLDPVSVPSLIDPILAAASGGGDSPFVGEDSAGNLYFKSADSYITVAPGGAVTQQPALNWNNHPIGGQFTMAVAADGTRYKADDLYVSKLDASGQGTVVSSPNDDLAGWNTDNVITPFLSGVGMDGNVYFHGKNGTPAGVMVVSPSGTFSSKIAHEGH